MRLCRSDAGWQEREEDIRADAVIVSMSPTKLSLGAVASLQSPLPFQPSKIIVPRIVIGGVILDQPADGGIGAAKRGASSLWSRAARSGVVGPPASLAARRIRSRRAAGPCSESHTGPQAWSTDSRSWDPRLIGPALAPDHAHFISPVQLSYCDCGTPSAKPGVGVSSTARRSCGHDLSLC